MTCINILFFIMTCINILFSVIKITSEFSTWNSGTKK